MPKKAADIDLHAELVFKLLKRFEKGCQGTLDAKPFQKCSAEAIGKRAFVVKGWIDTKLGPAIRFRAPWGRLGDGEVLLQPAPKLDWEECGDETIDLDLELLQLVDCND